MSVWEKNAISVIGLGKLGQPLAVCFAARGFKTVGVDIDRAIVDAINRKEATLLEPGLQELLDVTGDNLRATTDFHEAIASTYTSVVLVPTPSEDDGNFSCRYVEAALRSLGEALASSRKPYHLVIISSTVSLGTIEGKLIGLLEETSGRRLNEDFGLCYCPETVALGNTIEGFLRPDMVIIGESSPEAGEQAGTIYRLFCENNPPIIRMSLINAELTKLALNCYITTKISFANSLANLCERLPGADVDVITQAIGMDRRIGPHYLKGGLSYGGPCFPRDTRAYIALAKNVGLKADLIEAVERINSWQDAHLLEVVLREVERAPRRAVSVLGTAFKPGTPVITDSPSIKLIKGLLNAGVDVIVFDPLALPNTRQVFGHRIKYAESSYACVQSALVCVVAIPWPEFRQIDESYIHWNPTTIIDCWRILDPAKLGDKVRYVPLGRGFYGGI
jgi:UDPglucose 6-dehydrogenase